MKELLIQFKKKKGHSQPLNNQKDTVGVQGNLVLATVRYPTIFNLGGGGGGEADRHDCRWQIGIMRERVQGSLQELFDWILFPFYLLINRNRDSWCVIILFFVILTVRHTRLSSKEGVA